MVLPRCVSGLYEPDVRQARLPERSDGSSDGAKAWSMLQKKFCNLDKSTVRGLMAQLSQMKMSSGETMQEYIIRGQELATRVRLSGENLSDSLLNTMVLNGLPASYKQFTVQESFEPSKDFGQLRDRLVTFCTAKSSARDEQPHIAMASTHPRVSMPKPKGSCFVCGNPGHFARQCFKRDTAFCSKCKRKGHLPKACKGASGEGHTGGPKALTSSHTAHICEQEQVSGSHFIVDTGCTDHVVNNKDWMFDFVPCGEHVTNPDGSATEVLGRGTVKCHVVDDKGKPVEVELKEVLCVPGYKSNLLSVKTSAERKAAEFCFGKGAAAIKLSDGTKLPLRSAAGLYMLDASFVEAQQPPGARRRGQRRL